MTFGQFVKKNTGDIKVGAKNGTNFFYIGTCEDFLDRIEGYEEKILDYNNARLRGAKARFYTTSQNFPTPETYIKRNPKAKSTDYLKALDQWFNDYRRRKQIYEEWAEWMRTYTALQNRKVFDSYAATGYDEGYTIVLVEGQERGSYWTANEVTDPMNFTEIKEED